MAKFTVSEPATSDVEGILAYLISKYANDAARRIDLELYAAYERLSAFPFSGAKVRIKRFSHYRFVIVEKYYIFYTFKDNLITIERVLHTARNYKAILK